MCDTIAGPRRSLRISSRRADSVMSVRVHRMSLKKALKLTSTASRETVMSELKQLLEKASVVLCPSVQPQ